MKPVAVPAAYRGTVIDYFKFKLSERAALLGDRWPGASGLDAEKAAIVALFEAGEIEAFANRVLDLKQANTPTDNRPVNCRNRQRDEGQSYPKSGCDYCQTGGLTGCPLESRNDSTPALAPAALPELPFQPNEFTPHFRFSYRNHRGDVATRDVAPISISFGTTDWHKKPGYLMRAWDFDKKDFREFAMHDISAINPIASSLYRERDAWRDAATSVGVCQSCAGGRMIYEPHGCTDCLNTGFDQGFDPHERIRELETTLLAISKLIGPLELKHGV